MVNFPKFLTKLLGKAWYTKVLVLPDQPCGYPNRFYGWGGEDGVMYERIIVNGLKRKEVPKKCTMKADAHNHDHGNEKRMHYKSWIHGELKKEHKKHKSVISDGLSSIKYDILQRSWMRENALKILVEI